MPAVQAKIKESANLCPQCNCHVSPESAFCSNCGHNIQSVVSTSEVAVKQNGILNPEVKIEKDTVDDEPIIMEKIPVNTEQRDTNTDDTPGGIVVVNEHEAALPPIPKRSLLSFQKKKLLRVASIIIGILIVLFALGIAINYLTKENIKNDFSKDSRSSQQLHSLQYQVPASWEASGDNDSNGGQQQYDKYYDNEDSEACVSMVVYYEGEESSYTEEDIVYSYENNDYGVEYEKGEATIDGYAATVLRATDESEDPTVKTYITVFSCDESVFSVIFAADEDVYNEAVFDDILSTVDVSGYVNPKVLDSISAEYDGSRAANTRIYDENDDIIVTAYYEDGSTEEVEGWTVQNPKKLKADKTSTFNISFEGKNCTLKIKCSTVSKKAFMAKCKTYSFDELSRDPDKYEGKLIKISGKVLQEMTGSYRIATDGGWDNVVYINYYPAGEKRILEDDYITVYGTFDGLTSYETVLGATVTIPEITGKYVDR